MDENEQIIRDAAKEIAVLDAEIKELTERRDLLKSYFKDKEAYPPGKYDLGDVELVVTTNQRISQKKAEEMLGKRTLDKISTPKVDPKKARAYLRPLELEQIMDHYDHRIEVKLKGGNRG